MSFITYEEAHKSYIAAIERGDTRGTRRYYELMHKSIHNAMRGGNSDISCIRISWYQKLARRIKRVFK